MTNIIADPSLLLKAADAIEREPKSFNMTSWASKTECGTRLCAAGQIIVQAGYTPRFRAEGDDIWYWTSADGKVIKDYGFSTLALDLVGLKSDEDGLGYELYNLFFSNSTSSEVIDFLRAAHSELTAS